MKSVYFFVILTLIKSNAEASGQMFNERKELITKWWEKWNGKQRAECLQNLLGVCTNKQIRYNFDQSF